MSAVILQHVIFVCCLSDSFWAETRCWYHCSKSKANRTCKQFLALVCSVLSVKSHPSGSSNFFPLNSTLHCLLSRPVHITRSLPLWWPPVMCGVTSGFCPLLAVHCLLTSVMWLCSALACCQWRPHDGSQHLSYLSAPPYRQSHTVSLSLCCVAVYA